MTVKSFGLASAMVLGLVVFAGISVNAQNRPYNSDPYGYGQNQQDDRYNGRDRNGNQSYRFAFRKGYQDGVRQGMRDARNRGRGNNQGYYGNNGYYDNNQSYSNNNGGILGQIFGRGNNGNNKQAYQQGYQQGYREGLSRVRNNGRRNNNGGYYGN